MSSRSQHRVQHRPILRKRKHPRESGAEINNNLFLPVNFNYLLPRPSAGNLREILQLSFYNFHFTTSIPSPQTWDVFLLTFSIVCTIYKYKNTKQMKYKQIIVEVRTCAGYRVFTTKSFTIRALIVSLQRYAGKFDIISVSYGDYHGKSEWSEKRAQIPSHFDIYNENSGTELLERYNYRDAINYYYIQCANTGTYPSKSPFRGVKTNHDHGEGHGQIKHPTFIWDGENNYTEPSDILSDYDGIRIERYLNGEKVNGYLLYNNRKQQTNETGL